MRGSGVADLISSPAMEKLHSRRGTYDATCAAMVAPLEGGEAGGALHAHAGGHVPDPRRGSLPKLILRQLKQRHTNTSLREKYMQHLVPQI